MNKYLEINGPRVTLEASEQVSSDTTDSILVLSVVNETPEWEETISYAVGGKKPIHYTLPSGYDNVIMPVVIENFNGNRLTVTNSSLGGRVGVCLNGLTCLGNRKLPFCYEQTLEAEDGYRIGVNCEGSTRSRMLLLTAYRYATIIVFGLEAAGKPSLIGLNYTRARIEALDLESEERNIEYSNIVEGNQVRLKLLQGADITVINSSPKETPVKAQIYPIN